MRRLCLDCRATIKRGSRCRACQRRKERERDQRKNAKRPAYARYELPRQVKLRDGYRCVTCGSAERLEAHHIVPVSAGGEHTLENMVTLCHHCHREHHR